MNYKNLIKRLKEQGIEFEEGLTEKEFDRIQNYFKFYFPPDLKEFLSINLPISDGFVDWRNEDQDNLDWIQEIFDQPLEGILFDVDLNSFWVKSWGEKPTNTQEAAKICRQEYSKIPKLIPIYSHRYIPSKPYEEGNPVFSVVQTDIIYYGDNLETYLEVEFKLKKWKDINFDNSKEIKFWSDIAEGRGLS